MRRACDDGPVFSFSALEIPFVAAPMAGGPSTPELVAAVADSGGTGFLAAGYRTAAEMREQIRATRALTDRPFGVNLFVPNQDPVDDAAMQEYRSALAPLAERFDAPLPSWHPDDEDFDAKLAALQKNPVAFVSFTFGLPGAEVVRALHAAGTAVLATTTCLDEARAAAELGYDGLVVQGPEAGGHRGTHRAAAEPDTTPLLPLLASIVQEIELPVLAAGGLSEPAAIADALALADAVQLGTAYLDADEAGTSAIHRAALRDGSFTETVTTRAFTGRVARALRNEFTDGYTGPAHYPAVHQLTQPLRKAAAAAGDSQYVHLWAGTGWRAMKSGRAGELTVSLWSQVEELLRRG